MGMEGVPTNNNEEEKIKSAAEIAIERIDSEEIKNEPEEKLKSAKEISIDKANEYEGQIILEPAKTVEEQREDFLKNEIDSAKKLLEMQQGLTEEQKDQAMEKINERANKIFDSHIINTRASLTPGDVQFLADAENPYNYMGMSNEEKMRLYELQSKVEKAKNELEMEKSSYKYNERPLTSEEEEKNAAVEAKTRAQAIAEGLDPDGTYDENLARMKEYNARFIAEGLNPNASYAENIAILMSRDRDKAKSSEVEKEQKENIIEKLTPEYMVESIKKKQPIEVKVLKFPNLLEDGWEVKGVNYKSGLVRVEKNGVSEKVSIEDLKQWNKLEVKKNEMNPEDFKKGILEVKSFDDLEKIIEESGGVQGSQDFFDSKTLKDIINKVRKGEKSIDYITKTGGLRQKVEDLLKLEKVR